MQAIFKICLKMLLFRETHTYQEHIFLDKASSLNKMHKGGIAIFKIGSNASVSCETYISELFFFLNKTLS